MAVLYFRNKNGEMEELPAIAGRSAYKTALKNGFVGTEKEWLDSLKGEPGYTPQKGIDYVDGYTPQKGVDYNDGKDGQDGVTPVKGVDYWTESDKEEIKNYVADEVIGAEVVSLTEDRVLWPLAAGKFISVDSAAYITVPADVFSIGEEIEIFRNTADGVRICAASGVKFAVPGNAALVSNNQEISEQYSSVVLKQIATNVWSIQGAVA